MQRLFVATDAHMLTSCVSVGTMRAHRVHVAIWRCEVRRQESVSQSEQARCIEAEPDPEGDTNGQHGAGAEKACSWLT